MNENQNKPADELISGIQMNVVPPRPMKVVPYGTPEWCKSKQDQCDGQKAEIEHLVAVCRFRRHLIWVLITALICVWLYFACAESGFWIFLTLIIIPALCSVFYTNDWFTDRGFDASLHKGNQAKPGPRLR